MIQLMVKETKSLEKGSDNSNVNSVFWLIDWDRCFSSSSENCCILQTYVLKYENHQYLGFLNSKSVSVFVCE